MTSVGELAEFLAEIGQTTRPLDAKRSAGEISWVSGDRDAEGGALAWLSPAVYARKPERVQTFAGLVLIAPADAEGVPTGGGVLMPCLDPKLAFARAVNHFFPHLSETRWPRRGEATIPSDADIHPDAFLAAGVVLGSGVTVRADAFVGPNTVLAHCEIGERTRIGANCSVGLPGFGFAQAEDGRSWRFPHLGRVVIEHDVEIGSNTCVDRGALGDTYIASGARIDNLVHVSHNVVVGPNTYVIANSMLGGSSRFGERVWVAPSVAVRNQITVGDRALLGMGAVVVKNVEAGAIVLGNPAKPLPPRKKS